MQTEKFARIFKIAAAVIIFLSLDQNIGKTAVRAAIRPRITSAATETPIPMTSIQDSQKNAPTSIASSATDSLGTFAESTFSPSATAKWQRSLPMSKDEHRTLNQGLIP